MPNQWRVTGEWAFERGVWVSLVTETAEHAGNCYFNIPMLYRSVLTLLITLPITLFIALVIKLASRGPIFFVQDRVGLNGRVFRMYKFRTMQVGSREEEDTHWTSDHDPRRTTVGAFLRKTNLDELPQFLNVLKGDMSIVGPRPERPFFVQRFLEEIDRYNSRHMFKAGITGWAQVNGWRGDTSIAKRVEYDLYYLRNWSLTLDLVSTGNRYCGKMTVFRHYSNRDLQLDINLLTSGFAATLADALHRSLMEETEFIPDAQSPALLSAQAG